jgi:hypothetical protein
MIPGVIKPIDPSAIHRICSGQVNLVKLVVVAYAR